MAENKKKEKRRNKVTACITDEAKEKLDKICTELDVTMSWVISRLIVEASVDQLRGIFGAGEQ